MNDHDETRLLVAQRAGWKCEACGELTPYTEGQLAHRIPQRKHLVRKYGESIIHHPRNLAWVCGLGCNAAMSIAGHPLMIERLVHDIKEELNDE